MIIITCGLVKGYNNNKDPEWDIVDIVLKKMAQEVPFTFCFKKVFYNQEWGCPTNGEHIVEISAMCNPKFEPDYNKWVQKYQKLAKELSLILRQSTAQMYNIVGDNFFYIQNSEEEFKNVKRPYKYVFEYQESYQWLTDEEYEASFKQSRFANWDGYIVGL